MTENEEQQGTSLSPQELQRYQAALDSGEMVEKLLSNEHIPPALVEELWALFGRSSKLSFLDDRAVALAKIEFEMLKIDIIESIPKSEYDEQLEIKLRMISWETLMNINRSHGGRAGNEREMLATQITSHSERPVETPQSSSGYGQRLLRIFKGGN